MTSVHPRAISTRRRRFWDRAFVTLCITSASLSVLILAWLLIAIFFKGWSYLSWDFLTGFPSRRPAEAGFKPAIWGSVLLCLVCACVSLPLGVATAIFLEEYKPRGLWSRRLHGFIQLNITNLAGVPSIVYGIIGLTVFVRCFGLFGSPNTSTYDRVETYSLRSGEQVVGISTDAPEGRIAINDPLRGRVEFAADDVVKQSTKFVAEYIFTLKDGSSLAGTLGPVGEPGIILLNTDSGSTTLSASNVEKYATRNMVRIGNEDSFFYFRLPLGGSILAGGLTLSLVILPIVIISSREALRSVPDSLREGSFALGATRWQTVQRTLLPSAIPGIMTGAILAMSRAIGEAAPLLIVGGVLFILFTPRNLMDDFAAMPLQIFNWAGRPQEAFANVAAAGIIVLLGILMLFNLAAILIRHRFQSSHR